MTNVVKFTGKYEHNNEKLTDDQLIEGWLSTKQSPETRRVYRTGITDFKDWLRKPLLEATRTDLSVYNQHLQTRFDNKGTLQRTYSTLRSFYKWALDMEYVEVNPAKLSLQKLTPQYNPNERMLSKSEVSAIVGAAKQDARDCAVIALFLTTGVRVSELCKLNWRDLTQIEDHKGNFNWTVKVLRKGGKIQYLEVRDDVLKALLAYKRVAYGKEPNDPMFNVQWQQKVKRITEVAVRKIIKRLCLAAGINEEISPHWLRHTFASRTLANGASLADVSFDMGHAHLSTTEIYTHPLREGVADKMDIRFD